MKEEDVQAQALTFAVDYTVDVSEELVGEMLHLKAIHNENLGMDILSSLHLLNRLSEEKLDGLFPNVCVALRLFCTLPVSVAGAERSFSGLAYFKRRSSINDEPNASFFFGNVILQFSICTSAELRGTDRRFREPQGQKS